MKVFWFDTETTGVDPVKNGIIQLAYIVEIDGKVKDSGTLESNAYGKEIEDSALAVNGYTREEISKFPNPVQMKTNLMKMFVKYVNKYDRNDKFFAAGYNVDFDMNFLRQLWKDHRDNYFQSWFHFSYIDPCRIIPYLMYTSNFQKPDNLKLGTVAKMLGISNEGAHDAMADIIMSKKIVEKIKELDK